MSDAHITIIGGGVIGCAIAYELSERYDGIYLIEKNERIPSDKSQSARNSGVVHAGIYYDSEEPLKARFCVEGNRLLYDFCEEHHVSCKRTGKLIVATNRHEEEYLDPLLETSLHNSVPDVRMISGREAIAMEPNINTTSALYVPTTGIIDSVQYTRKLSQLAETQGVMFVYGHEVVGIEPKTDGFAISTRRRDYEESFDTKIIINAAGLYSDVVALMINQHSPYRIRPLRGEGAKFYHTKRPEITMSGMNVYPVPCGIWPDGTRVYAEYKEFQRLLEEGEIKRTVGVHLTPTFDPRTIIIIPFTTKPENKEDFRQTVPRERYLERIINFFPNITAEDIELDQVGIQAYLDGYRDFVIERDQIYPNCINLIGINSPGLTSSLAIARHVSGLL